MVYQVMEWNAKRGRMELRLMTEELDHAKRFVTEGRLAGLQYFVYDEQGRRIAVPH